jgi:cobalt-zinc-cadmium efflux system protein
VNSNAAKERIMSAEHHHHDHGHGGTDFNHAFAIGVFLNLSLVVAQVIFGIFAHSLALIADAGHNFADVLGLMLAWWASKLVKTIPTKKHTYGLRGASILVALANAVMLLVTMGAVAWEAVRRLGQPQEVAGQIVIWIAGLGLVINSVSACLFFSGRKRDLNIRGAFLHLAADAGISVGVLLAGVAILFTHGSWIDPMVSLIIVATILYGTWGLLKDSVNLALQAVPENVDHDAVEGFLKQLPAVLDVHDLHIWGMSTTEVALTAHLIMRPTPANDEFLTHTAEELHEKFNIGHATLQIESGEPTHTCPLGDEQRCRIIE